MSGFGITPRRVGSPRWVDSCRLVRVDNGYAVRGGFATARLRSQTRQLQTFGEVRAAGEIDMRHLGER